MDDSYCKASFLTQDFSLGPDEVSRLGFSQSPNRIKHYCQIRLMYIFQNNKIKGYKKYFLKSLDLAQ